MTSPESVVFISQRAGQFVYFDEQLGHPDWTGRVVLDFGGNVGNLLRDPGCPIRHEHYYCFDVIREAVRQGQARYPRAHFVHYDRYNWPLNLEGEVDLPLPDVGVTFDIAVAYSVFTHLPRAEMHAMVEQLLQSLSPGGVLAFTFTDPHFRAWPETRGNFEWQCDRTSEADPDFDAESLIAKSRGARWCSLVDRRELSVDGDGVQHDIARPDRRYDVYHTVGFMREEFPAAEIRAPVQREQQHCCIIRR